MTNNQDFSVVEAMSRAAIVGLVVIGFIQSVAGLI